MDMEIW
jgi:hypothetical protein